jgi:hypothetical protein
LSPARKKQTSLIGAAGEHLVMGELLRRGHIAALAPQGAPNMDILIADQAGNRLFSIQVKTRTQIGGDGGWHMGVKHETICEDQLFYVFVDLGNQDWSAIDYYVVPSATVSRTVRETHLIWSRNPGKTGQPRKSATTMRRIRPDYSSIYSSEHPDPKYQAGWMDKYKNAWHVFEAEP